LPREKKRENRSSTSCTSCMAGHCWVERRQRMGVLVGGDGRGVTSPSQSRSARGPRRERGCGWGPAHTRSGPGPITLSSWRPRPAACGGGGRDADVKSCPPADVRQIISPSFYYYIVLLVVVYMYYIFYLMRLFLWIVIDARSHTHHHRPRASRH
jgi:hypothetical protein